ncbi:TPA: H-NS histone family protein [Vibrio parahaemolyticus]|uniref:H-NS histone family protein n=1 Tax=Vibrio parahaemolyticus TaxID=670 RepID=UPI001B821FD5|nr:H-NS family nucleoid-associated regulatory protein [Vibrio parahaemolyticus]MDF5646689.1 H-NS family nucleoid-associated regulatory protein [Vibrio parahaemolyticus]MDF5666052.1 H-NS family nucleoid-associated regulatory protein [Vibrio parahaemolyticus]WKV19637.1 DNA-binding protein H-NS [Vibrio parahaemolyticus]HBC3540454.1 H-NS histone family protein [Vibrio parahaemolyticus]HBC3816842.1 H-NS histone family protein [Vibrio parahaemolyticus]
MANPKEAVEDFQAEFLSVMSRIRRMRKYLKGSDSTSMIAMKDRLEELILEREIEEEEERKAQEEKQRSIEEVKEMMKAKGLSESDLTGASSQDHVVKKEGKKPRKPKYLHIDDEGEEHRWNGKGRTPKYFADLIEKGVNIDKDCLARNLEPEDEE